MPWRLGPRAAVGSGLVGAIALTAVSGPLRVPDEAPALASSGTTSGRASSINDILTPDAEGCAGVRSTVWHPLSGLDYTGRLRVTLPPQLGGAITMYVGDSIPLDVDVERRDGRPLAFWRERFRFGPGVPMPPDYWLDDSTPADAPPEVTRLTIDADGEQMLTVRVWLGRRAPRVLARLIGYGSAVAVPVCAEPLRPLEQYFATGWYGAEPSDQGTIRWMREHGAVLVSSHGAATRVTIRAAPAVTSAAQPTVLRLRINGLFESLALPMRQGFAQYEWLVPDRALVPGTNELFFAVTRTEKRGSRTLGLALASLDVQ